ncbi:-dependent heme receptor A [Olea europaea subsp. europaea]|uniref:-dependent heme receptor A n=1 Tax=Olea europaea subsp. europaea TaxID=158383 RepID=A0A8S0VH77_OLEEU|nr:-dependent heme receptor A [Olea europaea subsp. europaea]
MAMNNGLRSCASKFLSSTESFLPKSVNRGFHSTGVKKMGGGHGHDEPFYLHAKHMYNLDRMKHQQLKMTLGVLSAFTIGVAVPVYAVIFQQKKTASA